MDEAPGLRPGKPFKALSFNYRQGPGALEGRSGQNVLPGLAHPMRRYRCEYPAMAICGVALLVCLAMAHSSSAQPLHKTVAMVGARSGAPGGAWNAARVKFKDGKPIVATH
jgi:hypothetical protein